MYSGAFVLVLRASGFMIIKHQVAKNGTENANGKLTFDGESQSQGVAIKGYQTNNGVFNDSDFM